MNHIRGRGGARAGAPACLMTCLMTCLVAFSVAFLVLGRLSPAHAQASKSDESTRDEGKRYRAHIEEALAAYEAGEFAEAYLEFAAAHELSPSARTHRGLGLAAYASRRYVETLTHLRAARDDARRPLTKKQRAEVEGVLAKAETYVGYVTLQVEPTHAQVRIDGLDVSSPHGQPIALDPGEHEVHVSANGYEAELRRVPVLGGDQRVLELQLRPSAPAGEVASTAITTPTSEGSRTDEHASEDEVSRSPLPWILGGVGVALVAGGVVSVAVAKSDEATVKERCEVSVPCPEQADTASRAKLHSPLGITLIGVGSAAITAAVVLLVLDGDRREEREPDATQVSMSIAPDHVALILGGTL